MQVHTKGSCFLLLFSGGIDSSQPVHSVSQNVPFSKPGAGTSASSAVMSSVRSPAPSLSSKPPPSPSVKQSPELALQEGTKREWEVTLETFFYSTCTHECWKFYCCFSVFNWSTPLASHQPPLVVVLYVTFGCSFS